MLHPVRILAAHVLHLILARCRTFHMAWEAHTPTSLFLGEVSDRPPSRDTLIRLSREVSLLAPTSLSSGSGRDMGCSVRVGESLA